ncbi:MAG: hypothetical protein J6X28_01935 [Bacilli bacterium]|nr:hypothetical protein [Bacilli bacterium]
MSTTKLIPKEKSESTDNNDILLELVLEEQSKTQDICELKGYRDLKSCTLSFSDKTKKRKIADMATDYALTTLGMEEVFLRINPEDKDLLEYLDSHEFECLGDEKGSIIYLKEKEY